MICLLSPLFALNEQLLSVNYDPYIFIYNISNTMFKGNPSLSSSSEFSYKLSFEA